MNIGSGGNKTWIRSQGGEGEEGVWKERKVKENERKLLFLSRVK